MTHLSYSFIIAGLLLIWLVSCQSQPTNPPSRISAGDSVRVFQLFDKAYEIQNTNPDSAYALIQQAGALSRAGQFDQGLFNYYNQAMFNRAAYRGDFTLATQLGDTALTLVKHPSRKQFRVLANFSRAITYQLQEMNDSAIVYYLHALDNQSFTKDTSRIPLIQNNLAILFHFQKRDDLAVKYQLGALRNALAKRDTGQLIGAYVNLYGFEVARKDTAKAFSYLTKGLLISRSPKTWREQTELFKNAGEYYVANRRTDSARHYFNRYYTITKALYPPDYLAQPLIGLAQTDWLEGNRVATEQQLNEIVRLTNPDSLPMLDRQNYYKTSYQLLKQTSRPAQALQALEKYNAAVAQFEDGEKNRQLIQYDEKVRQLQEARQHAERQLTLSRKNSIITTLIIGAILLAGVATLLVLYWRKRKMLESEKLAKLEIETEWMQLKSRLAAQLEERSRISRELHDELGATLTSISLASELLKQNARTDSPEVRIIAKASSEMTTKMNEIVWSLNANNDTVQSLVSYVRKFCADFLNEAGIQMVFNERISDPDRELKGHIRRSVYHSVKEAVHNVVKHAEASTVELDIETIENELRILIKDNGKGIPDNAAKRWGNGLRNMKKNIENIRGQISWATENGTSVRIQTPMSL